ncbi:MAG TPA: hypothetical protein EYN05_02040 [Nitrospinaceae bacterium]|nr:hypothetical protein [Nitrospinaceae bacterium]
MPAPTPKNTLQKNPVLFVSIIMLLGVCLRFYQMDRALGGGDENHMLLYFGYTHLQYIATTYFDASNHIFHTMMVNLMGQWFGEENAMAIRFPTFLFGIACLWMIYKVAWEMFASQKIALIALLIATVNPVHIYYSQTARGYSLMIFFSTAIVYFVIKILQLQPNPWHAIFLAICGFLSVYTLPTNVIFLIGLAGWLLTVLLVPQWSNEYSMTVENRKQRAFWFAGSAMAIALFTFLSFLPVLDQMTETARNHSLLTFNSHTASVPNLLPSIMIKIFQGPLIWYFPFLLIGLIYGKVKYRSYRFLPVYILFLPLLITAITGVGGFPRNYLFNFPLFCIFLAAGISAVGDHIGNMFVTGERKVAVTGLLIVAYFLTSLSVVFFEYYPSVKISNGNLYKEKVWQNNGPHGLLIINDPKNYLYARSTYKTAIQNILHENKLSRLNFIRQSTESIKEEEVFAGKGVWSLFQKLFKKGSLNFQDVSGGKEIAALSKHAAFPVLPDDFEFNAQWQIIQGSGEISKTGKHRLAGNQALKLMAYSQKAMIVKASVPGEYKLTRPSFVVVVTATKNFNPELMVYHPLIVAKFDVNGKKHKVKLLTEKVNDGINLQIKEKNNDLNKYYWKINAFLGILPPGSYNFDLFLKCHEGNSVLYDGLRLFIIEAV